MADDGVVAANDVVTIVLDGEPTLDDLTKTLTELRGMLRALNDEVASGVHIDWTIVSLDAGSAAVGLRGRADSADDAVSRVISRAEAVVGAFSVAGSISNDRAAKHAVALGRIVSDRVPSLRIETARDDYTIDAGDGAAQIVDIRRARQTASGAIEGRIQTLTNRGALRFTLYDLVHDKPVSCYLAADATETMRGAWGQLAVVEGDVRRNAQGRPTSVRNVQSVRVIRNEAERNDWRRAIGAAPRRIEGARAETVIRRIRDAR